MKALKPEQKPCLVCNAAGKPANLVAPGNVVVVVTICDKCAVDRFRVAEALRRIGVA